MIRKKPSASAERPKRKGADNTRRKILDAGEVLFGEKTFDIVSLRDITGKAQVTLHLASYHFGTKDELYAAVIARRAAVLGALRRRRLAKLEAAGVPTTRTILDAFMRPLFEKMRGGSRGWRSYILILAQLGQSNRWLHLLHDNFDPTAELFLAKLGDALPEVPRRTLMRGFALVLVAMLQTVAKNRRLDALSAGTVSSDDLDEAYSVLLRFGVGGLEKLAQGKRSSKARD